MDETEKNHGYRCDGCGHVEKDNDGNERLVGVKVRPTKTEGNAELLAKIHETKTGHNTRVF